MPTTETAAPRSKKAPVLIIKLDDLRGGGQASLPEEWRHVSREWRWLGDFFRRRQLKASIGVICDTLEDNDPEYIRWIKDLYHTGLVEFWFHAYDHLPWIAPDGGQYNEFDRPCEDQRRRFESCQQLALQRLGFLFHVFALGQGCTFATPSEYAAQAASTQPAAAT